jgi:hypothetical protein
VDACNVLTINVIGSNAKPLILVTELPDTTTAVILAKRVDLWIVKHVD